MRDIGVGFVASIVVCIVPSPFCHTSVVKFRGGGFAFAGNRVETTSVAWSMCKTARSKARDSSAKYRRWWIEVGW